MGSLSILKTRFGSPVARNIHIGMTCSRDRAALPTGFPQKTQFFHPGSFGALARWELWGISEGNPWSFSNSGIAKPRRSLSFEEVSDP
jgi:hypothetical protein